MQRGNFALALALLASQTAWADLTIRYKFEVKFGAVFPAAAVDAAKQQIASVLPGEVATRVKGDKCASSFGPLSSIMDGGKGEITLLNPATKQFATVPAAGYMEKVLALEPPQLAQAVLQNLKFDVQTKKTGETAVIQGVQTEDNLVIVTMEMPNPTGAPIGLRMEMHEWLALADELTRVPALNQMAGCSTSLGASADPGVMIERILGPLGGASGLSDALKQLATGRGKLVLKIQIEIFAPAILAIMQTQRAAGLPPNADLNAPLIDLNFNVAELSADPLPDAMFQAPEGYQAAPLEDLLKTMTKPVRSVP